MNNDKNTVSFKNLKFTNELDIDQEKYEKPESTEEKKLRESHLNSGWKLVQEVLQVYKEEEKIKRVHRKRISTLFLSILFIELIGIFILITFIGLGNLKYESDQIIIVFITTTFVEIVGITSYIVTSIFKSDKILIKIIEKIVSGINPK